MLKEHRMKHLFVLFMLSCLNPYFNGTCSKRAPLLKGLLWQDAGLNPYFNGTCSKRSQYGVLVSKAVKVLILILMEHAQRGVNLKSNIYDKYVLILILMEHAQRGMFIHSHSCVY